MSHDVLMMVYGALIGVGSSIITTLFQSWINRLERKRQYKEEKKREQRNIQIPTASEINAIRSGKYLRPESDDTLNTDNRMMRRRGCALYPVTLFLGLLLCGGISYLIYRIDNPILYLIVSGLVGFSVTFIIIKSSCINRSMSHTKTGACRTPK
jgi:hypothetical protein